MSSTPLPPGPERASFSSLVDPTREARSRRWIVVAVVAVFLLLAFRQNASLPATLGSTWTQVLMLGCGAAWLVSRLYRDPDPTIRDGAWLIALVHVSVTSLSWGLSSMRGIPLGAHRETLDLAMLQDIVVLLFFGFLLANLISLPNIVLTVKAIVAGTTVSAMYGLLDLFVGIDLAGLIRPPLTRAGGAALRDDLMREGMLRAQGAAGHPLELGILVATVLPLAISLVFVTRSRGGRPLIWLLCSGVLLLSIATSLSRSALVGTILALSVMAAFWTRPRIGQLARLGLVAGIALIVLRPGILGTIFEVFAASATDDSIYSREFGRTYAIGLWLDHVLFGIGPSAYAVPYNPVLDNQYLARLVETGVTGLLTMVVLWSSALAVAVRAARRCPREATGETLAIREMAIGLVGALVVVLISNTVLDTLGFRQVSTLTWYILALAWAVKRLALHTVPPASRPPHPTTKGMVQSDGAVATQS